VVLGFLLWVLVDLGTAGGFRLSYFAAHGPLLLAFYLGFPVAFAWLIFGWHWSGWRLLGATLVAMLLVEGPFTRNPLVLSFPSVLIGAPLGMCIYSVLTYFPLWVVRGEIQRRLVMVAALSFVVVGVMWLTTFGGQGR
jgi:hypothetical protein